MSDILSHGHQLAAGELESDPQLLALRSELSAFELGRFLLENLGLNGRWTSYVLLHPERGRLTRLSSDGSVIGELEDWLLNRCPLILATQERFRIARQLTQRQLRPGMKLASLPAGLMDDLLSLEYGGLTDIELTGIDLDPQALEQAACNAGQLPAGVQARFELCDAWQLQVQEPFDLLTSNGLNIYVQDDERCLDFYRRVAQALRPGGLFLISFITPAQQWQPHRPEDLDRQRLLFQRVIAARWNCLRDEQLTRRQLEASGFDVLEVHHDTQRMFPTALARRR